MNVGLLHLSSLLFYSFKQVKRVHFLRVRALKKRWEEEYIILNYEMQWTVRYFLNEAEKWRVGADTNDISVGAKAYALRQEGRWRKRAFNSDNVFKRTSSDYASPII